MELQTIRQVSKEYGVSVRMLRYYDAYVKPGKKYFLKRRGKFQNATLNSVNMEVSAAYRCFGALFANYE